ncbi:dedicator of cytokinesis protein 1 [Trichonephila inaurata madagascariensis]|uniref:Dedicator of cytokinesis protein 1 n=1 Tax=Trichonephila inaurata madagascariensis TaxID=2747483 RepID=A0A8X6YWI1_9ARAC|nr:dedicator of cytokinesis protein 1 [Trichonephila inaurata madagascariensis]
MIMLQNSVILKALRHFSVTIRDRFTNPFEIQVWNNFFRLKYSFFSKSQEVPLLEAGIAIHKQKAPESLKPFHQHMEEAFLKLRTSIEEKYGKKEIPPELQERIPVTIRRMKSTLPAK